MGRLLRIAGILVVALVLILVGVEVGLFIRMNDAWVAMKWPLPQASADLVGPLEYETPVWVLCLGWIVAATLVAAAVAGLPIYLARRRRARAETARLTREVAALRNLPIRAPAPLEDLPGDEAADDAVSTGAARPRTAGPRRSDDFADPVIASDE